MFDMLLDWWDELDQQKRKIVIGVALGVVLVILVAVSVIWGVSDNSKDKDKNSEFTNTQETEFTEDTGDTDVLGTEFDTEIESDSEIVEEEDPQSTVGGNMTNQNGASVDISQVVDKLPTNETQELTLGIDVARYQGTIDWKKGCGIWC